MNFEAALAYLYSLGHETLALKLGLRTTELLLNSLGNPQYSYPAVQIAGTNGKGSTAVMLDSICNAAGIRAGLFTSPHLISITERIRISGADISRKLFGDLATEVRKHAENLVSTGKLSAAPTFFEQVTAITLLAFARCNVELAILETGLGGRLDSTTAVHAKTIGITPIALDHQEYLGETIAEIAAEKAAVVQEGATVVIAPQELAAEEVILQRCATVGVTARFAGGAKIMSVDSTGCICASFETDNDTFANVQLGLRGRHQVTNASVAIGLAEILRANNFKIGRTSIIEGLEQAKHAGRLELIEGQPNVLLDGAHNSAGVVALRAYLDEFVVGPLTLIFGAMRDKNLKEMATSLFPRADLLILTQPVNERAASLESLLEIAKETTDCR